MDFLFFKQIMSLFLIEKGIFKKNCKIIFDLVLKRFSYFDPFQFLLKVLRNEIKKTHALNSQNVFFLTFALSLFKKPCNMFLFIRVSHFIAKNESIPIFFFYFFNTFCVLFKFSIYSCQKCSIPYKSDIVILLKLIP